MGQVVVTIVVTSTNGSTTVNFTNYKLSDKAKSYSNT